MLEDDLARSELLNARDAERGAASEADLEGAGEQGLGNGLAGSALDVGPGRDQLLEDGRRGAVTKLDDRPRQQRLAWDARRPAQDDGTRESRARRHPHDDALVPCRAGQLR